LTLQVPLSAKALLNSESRAWQVIYLSNGAFYIMPSHTREVFCVTRQKLFPRDLYVTGKQLGIAVTLKCLDSLIHEFNDRTDLAQTIVQYLNRLYAYKRQLTRDAEMVDHLSRVML
jgi:hypothetical protein